MFQQKQLSRLPNQRDGISSLPSAANSISLDAAPVLPQRIRLRLSGQVLSVAAANDYGSLKLCDLPAGNLIMLGVIVDLTGVVAGFASDVGTAVDLALGTVVTASTTFVNAGEDDLMEKIDGTGAGTTATLKGAGMTDGSLANVKLPAGAKAVWLNASDPVTTGTGTITLSGVVDLYYLDLSDHS